MSDNVLPTTRVAEEPLTFDLGTGETGAAPPFLAPTGLARTESPLLHGLPGPGVRLGDFDLLKVLGSGSFARVYLARQLSLGRMVALKVSRNKSQEARTLASLEHDHVVRVFSETIDPDHSFRLLCMQYVAGTTLERIINGLRELPPESRDGRAVLAVLDGTTSDPFTLDLGGWREREALADMDLVEAGCWLGARLAEALAHAHGLGILHRDIKPANILVNRSGRPLLADFNIAATRAPEGGGAFGGTVAYMSPEHLDAFNPEDFTPQEAVDARSDVWSLGAVLFEFFTGSSPYPVDSTEGPAADVLRRLADQRRQPPPRLDGPPALQRVMARCLAPRPADRYQSAAELAADLDSCRELRRVHRDLPPGFGLSQWYQASPFLVGIVLLLLPHVLATFVNIAYNRVFIVEAKDGLNDRQQAAFWMIVPFYNALCFSTSIAIVVRRALPVYRAWQALRGIGEVDADAVDEARRRALTLAWWAGALGATGWLVGGVVYPVCIGLLAGQPTANVYFHFAVSFAISGLIAVTYSFLAAEFIAVRVLYPALWLDARKMHEAARRELGGQDRQLGGIQVCAVLIPLVGAALMIWMPQGNGDLTFRLLVTALLALGMAGLGLAMLAGSELRQTVERLVR